ncbi:unnamed protein product [Caenorhabditis angaria]|uniref:Uncharacterized protein n=1 Tax=Caenorhabditis angaria TaxID=860376 RepID=A0A9P1IU27_9PELO|nr:unnamed protein product [Caenorhabditis angaria]
MDELPASSVGDKPSGKLSMTQPISKSKEKIGSGEQTKKINVVDAISKKATTSLQTQKQASTYKPMSTSRENIEKSRTFSSEAIVQKKNSNRDGKGGTMSVKTQKPASDLKTPSKSKEAALSKEAMENTIQQKTLSAEPIKGSKRNSIIKIINSKDGGKSKRVASRGKKGYHRESRESARRGRKSLRKKPDESFAAREMDTQDDSLKDLYRKMKATSQAKSIKSPEECLTQGSSGSKEKGSKESKESKKSSENKAQKPTVNTLRRKMQKIGLKPNNTTRKKKYDQELEEWYVQAVSYRCDTTRYRCKYERPFDLLMQYMFPPLLTVFILFTTLILFIVFSKDFTGYHSHTTAIQQISKIQYDRIKYEKIDDFLNNQLNNFKCTGIYQFGYYEIESLRDEFYDGRIIKKAIRAESYRWMNSTHSEFNGLINCPPSIVIEFYDQE